MQMESHNHDSQADAFLLANVQDNIGHKKQSGVLHFFLYLIRLLVKESNHKVRSYFQHLESTDISRPVITPLSLKEVTFALAKIYSPSVTFIIRELVGLNSYHKNKSSSTKKSVKYFHQTRLHSSK